MEKRLGLNGLEGSSCNLTHSFRSLFKSVKELKSFCALAIRSYYLSLKTLIARLVPTVAFKPLELNNNLHHSIPIRSTG